MKKHFLLLLFFVCSIVLFGQQNTTEVLQKLRAETAQYKNTLVINNVLRLCIFTGVEIGKNDEIYFALIDDNGVDYWQKPSESIVFLIKNIKDTDYGKLIHSWYN